MWLLSEFLKVGVCVAEIQATDASTRVRGSFARSLLSIFTPFFPSPQWATFASCFLFFFSGSNKFNEGVCWLWQQRFFFHRKDFLSPRRVSTLTPSTTDVLLHFQVSGASSQGTFWQFLIRVYHWFERGHIAFLTVVLDLPPTVITENRLRALWTHLGRSVVYRQPRHASSVR
jgi:hypothetical protein